MLKEQLILKETLELAKVKGFEIHQDIEVTQSLIQKWLREVHEIDVYVIPYTIPIKNKKVHKMYGTLPKSKDRIKQYESIAQGFSYSGYSSYEEALEIVLVAGLNIIENE